MNFDPLIPAEFIKRLNRFVCLVNLKGKEEKVLLRNTGRLKELLLEGRRVFLKGKQGGKYRYELVLVELPTGMVCVDSHLPPKLLVEYLRSSSDPWELKSFRYEFQLGGSRFDLLINGKIIVETKSVNLVVNSVALFPDAPTARGKRHLKELMNKNTYDSAIVFVVQREDAESFSPNWDVDPAFSRTLKEFYDRGRMVKAFSCRVSLEGIYIDRAIPVII